MKKRWSLLLVLVLFSGAFYSVPPYTIQAAYYFSTHSDELNAIDNTFKESDAKRWVSENNSLAPIFKTDDGSRLYFMGSLRRFGVQYDIAFIKGGSNTKICNPYLIYTSQGFNCNIPLPSGWVINYQSIG